MVASLTPACRSLPTKVTSTAEKPSPQLPAALTLVRVEV
jgi:hypothetical protein